MASPPPELPPPPDYIAQLARKRMAAGVLFRDPADRVLLVEPSYKPNWEIPGGAVEAEETPWGAARRELAEELGWDRTPGRLLVVDHVRRKDLYPEGLMFVFDGGVVDADELATVVLAEGELLSAGWYGVEEMRAKVKPALADRVVAAVEAARSGETLLCEQGKRIS